MFRWCTKWQKLVLMLCAKPPICCKPTAITIQYGGSGDVSPDGVAGAEPMRKDVSPDGVQGRSPCEAAMLIKSPLPLLLICYKRKHMI